MSTPRSAGQRTVEVPPVGHYPVDTARSTITFRTRHMFGLGPVRGSFALLSGDVRVADPPAGSSVRAEVAADSFTTGTGARDGAVRSRKYLDVANHPVISFRSDGVGEAEGGWTLHGTLTVRDVERPVGLTIESCGVTGGELRVLATIRIDRTEFGITAQRGMTGRYLDLVLDLVLGEAGTPETTDRG